MVIVISDPQNIPQLIGLLQSVDWPLQLADRAVLPPLGSVGDGTGLQVLVVGWL